MIKSFLLEQLNISDAIVITLWAGKPTRGESMLKWQSL